jgi:sulfur carrier protein ThiS
MPKLTLSSPLLQLVPDEIRGASPYRRSVPIDGRSWAAVAEELRTRFPALAERVLSESDGLQRGFVLVVNDEVLPRRMPDFELTEDDEICLLAAIAGG